MLISYAVLLAHTVNPHTLIETTDSLERLLASKEDENWKMLLVVLIPTTTEHNSMVEDWKRSSRGALNRTRKGIELARKYKYLWFLNRHFVLDLETALPALSVGTNSSRAFMKHMQTAYESQPPITHNTIRDKVRDSLSSYTPPPPSPPPPQHPLPLQQSQPPPTSSSSSSSSSNNNNTLHSVDVIVGSATPLTPLLHPLEQGDYDAAIWELVEHLFRRR